MLYVLLRVEPSSPEPKKASKEQGNSHFRARQTEAEKGLVKGRRVASGVRGRDPGQEMGDWQDRRRGRPDPAAFPLRLGGGPFTPPPPPTPTPLTFWESRLTPSGAAASITETPRPPRGGGGGEVGSAGRTGLLSRPGGRRGRPRAQDSPCIIHAVY